ncbi:MAG: hypothetical protein K6F99_02195 [Lachnospiraceae bacterium]|nr:hypothetical protein [Lachnospiraceae bacterium]
MKNEYSEDVKNYISNILTEKKEPKDDEYFLEVWKEWFDTEKDTANLLNSHILPSRPVDFKEPENITGSIYSSYAGEIPMIIFGNPDDFEHFVINAAYKGVWTDEVKKQGASFLAGKTNRFIVLSKKPYSNVPASWMGLGDADWHEKSMILRREHEYMHYYTRRYYGSAKQNLHDELMADFFGIYAAFGRYEAKWFDHFMGVDGREGGRITVYTQKLSEEDRAEVLKIAGICSSYLEEWSGSEEFASMNITQKIDHLCELGIEGMIQKKNGTV